MPPNANAKILTARPNVRFLSQAVQPPSQVYVQLEDVLRIAVASTLLSETVTLNYRLLLADGRIVSGQSSLAITAPRVLFIHDEPLAEGFLLSASCRATSASTRGQTFARVFLTNPVLGSGQPSYMLMADYVTTRMAPAHPNGRVLAPTEGPGVVGGINVPAPGAGADWSFTFPTNSRHEVYSLLCSLTTGVAAGNRIARFDFNASGVGVVHRFQSITAVPPSSTRFFVVAAPGTYTPSAGDTDQIPMPRVVQALGGDSISSVTTGLAAGDQWSAALMSVTFWIDNV